MFTPYTAYEKQAGEKRTHDVFLQQPLTQLDNLKPFEGAGIYALYYTGAHSAYADLGNRPIYVGKAIMAGGRKGLAVATTGKALYQRIRQHRNSISDAVDLEVSDFFVRFMVVESDYISGSENFFISLWKPVWNAVLDGFGNHAPGAGRLGGAVSLWDAFHPGRKWSGLGKVRTESVEEIHKMVTEYVKAQTFSS